MPDRIRISDAKGQSLAEYGLVGALVLVVLIPAVMLASGNISGWFQNLSTSQKQSIDHTQISVAAIANQRKSFQASHANDGSFVKVKGKWIQTDGSASTILVSGGSGNDLAMSTYGIAATYKDSNPALFAKLNNWIKIQKAMNDDMINFKGNFSNFYPAISDRWLKNAADYKNDFVTSAEFKSMPPECQAYILEEYRILYNKSFAFARDTCINKGGFMCGIITVYENQYRV